jgi:hypothetical protein
MTMYDSDFTHISCKPMLLPMFLPMFYYVPVIFLTSRHTKNRSPVKPSGLGSMDSAKPSSVTRLPWRMSWDPVIRTSAGEKKRKKKVPLQKDEIYEIRKLSQYCIYCVYIYMYMC